MSIQETKLLTVRDFCNRFPSWPSESALRAIILDSSWGKNNFKTAFKRVGRRILVDETEFWKCVDREEDCKNASKR